MMSFKKVENLKNNNNNKYCKNLIIFQKCYFETTCRYNVKKKYIKNFEIISM